MALLAKVLLLLAVSTIVLCDDSYTPIVIWHGLGDNCCIFMGYLAKILRLYLPGAHVVSLKLGDTILEDAINGVIMHPDKQIEMVCDMIKKDALLANGFNAIGYSQGSQMLRGLVQRCSDAKVKNLITLAGQHQGVYGFPECNPGTLERCDDFRKLLSSLAYMGVFQENLVPATYWHNPVDEDSYVQGSTYLADINNERYINETYIKNLQRLEKFVMVKHLNDTTVIPKESSWFGFYKPGQDVEVQSLYESDLFIQDRLGLKQMAEHGKLVFLENDWKHADFDISWFETNIINEFLK